MITVPSKLVQIWTAVVPWTYAVQPRSTKTQTSGSKYFGPAILTHADLRCTVFKLPLEIFLKIFSYFADHRRFIRENYYGKKLTVHMERKHAERSVVIRRLTMTCWPLRNGLLPLLWTDVEGCISHISHDREVKRGTYGSSPYAQCVYLASNQAIAACVQCVRSRLFRLNVVHGRHFVGPSPLNCVSCRRLKI